MLRRRGPLCCEHLQVSDSDTESDNPSGCYDSRTLKQNRKGKHMERQCHQRKRNKKDIFVGAQSGGNVKTLKANPDSVVEHAKRYQEHMKQIPIPTTRESDVVFITWQGLVKSMKQLYEQPLHYLTHVLVQQWDQSRMGAEEEDKPVDDIIHRNKAEAIVWDVEEVHRRCTSHVHLARLWLRDPDYHALVDEVIPPS